MNVLFTSDSISPESAFSTVYFDPSINNLQNQIKHMCFIVRVNRPLCTCKSLDLFLSSLCSDDEALFSARN
jgi:hypothetical protein